ncbi:MAG: hypothetical protein NTY19_06735 [Planctomycetota bacterium]|nr:hypothetical protein [Planctomycetota bacterium]
MPQSIPKGLTREHVLKALADLDAGIDYPFGKPTGTNWSMTANATPPKAVIGIADWHLTGEILHPSRFSGGEAPGQANYELRRLGFKVEAMPDDQVQTPTVWSDVEVGLLIADYFDLLQLDMLGRDYSKAEHNWLLRETLAARSKGSVEFKHQNVSAVLLKLGLPYINGYKPAKNYQRSLVDAVRAYLEANPILFTILDQTTEATPDKPPKLDNWQRMFEAPPTFQPNLPRRCAFSTYFWSPVSSNFVRSLDRASGSISEGSSSSGHRLQHRRTQSVTKFEGIWTPSSANSFPPTSWMASSMVRPGSSVVADRLQASRTVVYLPAYTVPGDRPATPPRWWAGGGLALDCRHTCCPGGGSPATMAGRAIVSGNVVAGTRTARFSPSQVTAAD